MNPADPIHIAKLIEVYASGAFPMAGDAGEIDFYTADPRALVPLDNTFHAPRTALRDIRRGRFTFRTDTAFAEVLTGCAEPRRGATEEDIWLSGELKGWVTALHHAGFAHSLEAWATDASGEQHLVGGIYGVSIGTAFLGESMFHRARPRQPDGSRDPADGTGASAACLVRLQQHLVSCGYVIFDAQIPNPHTERFGLVSIPLDEYQRNLARAALEPDAWQALSDA